MKSYMLKRVRGIILGIMSIIYIISFSNFNIKRVQAVEAKKHILSGKNIAFIGDSITSLENRDNKEVTDSNEEGHYKYIDWLREYTGANCYNFALGGSTVSRLFNSVFDKQYSMVNMYEKVIEQYPDRDKFDVIIVFGGVNDWLYHRPLGSLGNDDVDTFYGALERIVYQLQLYYTKARVVLMTPLISRHGERFFDTMRNNQGDTLEDYRKAIREVSGLYGAAVFETPTQSGLNSRNDSILKKYYDAKLSDGVHPNQEGHKRIAAPLINFLSSLFFEETNYGYTADNYKKSKLHDKNIAFLGDELTSIDLAKKEEGEPSGSNERGKYKYVDWIRELGGANSYNFGVNEASVARVKETVGYEALSGNSNLVDISDEMISKYPDENFWDVIVIFGGLKDYSRSVPLGDMVGEDETTFYGALNSVIYKLQANYPKAKIIVMTPLISFFEGRYYDYNLNGEGVIIEEYRKALRNAAKLHGAYIFETRTISGLNPNNIAIKEKYYVKNENDGLHPNEEGHRRIAEPLINYIGNLFYE